MSIQAVKGVEIGDGFEVAGRRGSRRPRPDRLGPARGSGTGGRRTAGRRHRGRHVDRRAARGAGGHEAPGHAEPARPQDRRRRDQGGDGLVQGAHRRHRRAGHGRGGRDDGGAGAGRRGAAQVRRRLGGRVRPQRRDASVPGSDRAHLVLVGHDGLGQDHGRSSAGGPALGAAFFDSDELVEARDRPHGAGDLRGRRRGGLPPARDRRPRRRAGLHEPAVIAAAGGVVLVRGQPHALRQAGAVRRVAARRPGAAGRAGPSRASTGRCSTATRRAPCAGSSTSGWRSTPRWPTWSSTSTAGRWPSWSTPCSRAAAHHDPRRRARRRSGLRRARRPRRAPAACPTCCPPACRRVAVVTQAGIPVDVDAGRRPATFLIGDGEAGQDAGHRRGASAASFARWGLTRADAVVAVGGGVVTDVGRVRRRRVPPGGRRSCTCPPRCSAWSTPPSAARPASTCRRARTWSARSGSRPRSCATPRCSTTLPEREWRSGLGEMAKYHFLDRRRPLGPAARRPGGPLRRDQGRRRGGDEREAPGAGRRASLLNYGHTLAHALEIAGPLRPPPRRGGRPSASSSPPSWPSARADRRRPGGRAPRGGRRLRPRHRAAARASTRDELLELMGRDKKALGGLTFVLDGPRGRGAGRPASIRAVVDATRSPGWTAP